MNRQVDLSEQLVKKASRRKRKSKKKNSSAARRSRIKQENSTEQREHIFSGQSPFPVRISIDFYCQTGCVSRARRRQLSTTGTAITAA